MKTVRIIKARDNQLWYSDMVGSEWEVLETKHYSADSYYVVDRDGHLTHGIYVDDCIEVSPLPDELFEL